MNDELCEGEVIESFLWKRIMLINADEIITLIESDVKKI